MQHTFTLDRETKGTYRYREDEPPDGTRPDIGTIYLTKPAARALGDGTIPPARIAVTITAAP